MAAEYLGTGIPDGTILGRDADAKIAFHGATPTDQYTLAAALATTTPVKASAGPVFGFSTSAKMNALLSLVSSMRALLAEKGLGA